MGRDVLSQLFQVVDLEGEGRLLQKYSTPVASEWTTLFGCADPATIALLTFYVISDRADITLTR